MIISASRRTDIPALYSDWFIKRISEKLVFVRNPMNIHQVSRVDLSPNVVDCIVFWTKNAQPLVENLNMLDKYKYYFQYTVTNYPEEVEPNVPSLKNTVTAFKKLENIIGRKRIIWRYDPIILAYKFNFDWHKNNFEMLCDMLSRYTEKCVISFVDFYKNTKLNLIDFKYKNILETDMYAIAVELKNIANKYDIYIESCSESIDLEKIGIRHGKCIDDQLIEEIINCNINIKKDKNQRAECGCMSSIDIGAYNTCTNGCLYCYANTNNRIVNKNYSSHDKNSPLLFGEIENKDKITERKCVSCKIFQSNLFNC